MSKLKRIIAGQDLGFGSRSLKDAGRLIAKGGQYNTSFYTKGLREINAYYEIIHMPWWLFFLMLFLGYAMINVLFAGIYYFIGVDQLTGGDGISGIDAFFYAFYFSTQTLTTVGFGGISPVGHFTNLVAAIEAMVGLVGFAFGTGIMYGRFSKARTRILFSKKALITPFQDGSALKVRVVNRRKNQLIGMTAKMTISYLYQDDVMNMKRTYDSLPLEISTIALFPLPWTIVHAIDEHSPLYGKSMADLALMDVELIVILTGYDDTFNQQVHRINSYKFSEFLFDHDFISMFSPDEKSGTTKIFLDRLSHVKKVLSN